MSIRGRRAGRLLVVIAATLLFPLPAEAQEPEKLDIPVFEVQLADEKGTARKTFSGGENVHVDVRFTLALSASSRYATTITFIQDADGTIVEKILWEGTLGEGHYRFFASTGKPPGSSSEVMTRVILKTRVFPKKFTGESYYVYRIWEGSYAAGGGRKNGAEGGT